jgi:hypothetical protein
MADIIKSFPVRSSPKEKSHKLKCYFDSGSPRTFVKYSAVADMSNLAPLSTEAKFYGLGNGGFYATHFIYFEVKLLDIWVMYLCYVVPDDVLGEEYDVLLGHDFMQIYDIQLKPRQREVVIRREALNLALKVR